MRSVQWEGAPTHRRIVRNGGPRKRRLCSECAAGEHAKEHSRMGCLRSVAPEPHDHICQCKVAA